MFSKCVLALLLLLPVTVQAASYTIRACEGTEQQAMAGLLHQFASDLRHITSLFIGKADIPALQTWFGNQEARLRVQSAFLQIQQRLSQSPPLIFSCAGPEACKRGVLGYGGNHEIHLCLSEAQKPSESGYDTPAGTLVHELSHLLLSTRDDAYGLWNARELARTAPQKALENADNYGYFFESIINQNYAARLKRDSANSCFTAYNGRCDSPCLPATDQSDCLQATQHYCGAQLANSARLCPVIILQ